MTKEYEVEKCEMCGGDAPVEFSMYVPEDAFWVCPKCVSQMREDEIAYAKEKGVDVMEMYKTEVEDTE